MGGILSSKLNAPGAMVGPRPPDARGSTVAYNQFLLPTALQWRVHGNPPLAAASGAHQSAGLHRNQQQAPLYFEGREPLEKRCGVRALQHIGVYHPKVEVVKCVARTISQLHYIIEFNSKAVPSWSDVRPAPRLPLPPPL